MNRIYNNLNECIHTVLKLASEFAIDGVNNQIGGPFGAGIIQTLKKDEYKILNIERNNVISTQDITGHAEINAIKKVSRILDRIDLNDCILVSTAKSCPMCLSAACWANIKTIYYGVDYSCANASGFKDSQILDYLKGNNNSIIKENKINSNVCQTPFEIWQKLENKIMY